MAAERDIELPVTKYKRSIISAVERNKALVIVGETGSGKSTQIPQFLHEAGFTLHGKIAITQPRRLGAISVAARVSQEMNNDLGGLVGYQVRFDDCTSSVTKIKYVTDGCLLREFTDDPNLLDYSVVVLDEAHERSLDTDILFGLLKRLFISKPVPSSSRKQPLKIIVMSASLDHEKFSDFFGSCPVFRIPGSCFPVQKIYCNYIQKKDVDSPNYLTKAVSKAMKIHTESPPGHILIFLTGQEEIESACDKLFEKAENLDYRYDVSSRRVNALLVLPLYGSMPTELQRRVFEPAERGVRKVIVATNIAATSLTVEGIRYVIDSGFVKQLSFNPRTGLDSLNIVLISRSEALQRAGRAGRTEEGTCYRLYSREVFEDVMQEETAPEIQRTNLTKVVLHLKMMGIDDVLGFDYIDRPEERMIVEAMKQLYILGALDRNGVITELGQNMVHFPLSPSLSRAILASLKLNCDEDVLIIAAMLSVENVFVRVGDRDKLSEASKLWSDLSSLAGGRNDFLTLLYIFQECFRSNDPNRWCREHFIHWRALKTAVNIVQQLKSIVERQEKTKIFRSCDRGAIDVDKTESILMALCQGFFHSTARRGSGSSFRTMDGHGTAVFIHPSSALFGRESDSDWILFHEVIWTSKIYVKTVSPIQYGWVKDLLPRLHEADTVNLAGTRGTQSQSDDGNHRNTNRRAEPAGQMMLAQRNTKESIAAARERYFARRSTKQKESQS